MQDAIVQNLWAQYGALGLLAASGWFATWTLWKANQKNLERFIALTEATIKVADETKNALKEVADNIPPDLAKTLDELGDKLSVQDMIKELVNQT